MSFIDFLNDVTDVIVLMTPELPRSNIYINIYCLLFSPLSVK